MTHITNDSHLFFIKHVVLMANQQMFSKGLLAIFGSVDEVKQCLQVLGNNNFLSASILSKTIKEAPAMSKFILLLLLQLFGNRQRSTVQPIGDLLSLPGSLSVFCMGTHSA